MIMKLAYLLIAVMVFFGTLSQSNAKDSSDKSSSSKQTSTKSTKAITTKEVFSSVSAKQAEIQGYIDKKKLDNIHEPAFEIAKLSKELTKTSDKLSEADQKKRDASLKKIDELAALLDKYGDAGDATQTKATFKKLQDEVTTLKGLYGMKSTSSSSAKLYTCTMHPEVISDKPGNCPKCGMKLVEKK